MLSRTLALGAAASAALTLAACGGSSSEDAASTAPSSSAAAPAGGTATTQFVLAKAATATQQAQTARVTLRQRISGAGLPKAIDLRGSGVTSLTEPQLDLTYDLGPLLRLAGQGSSSSDATARIVVDGSRLDIDPPALPGITLPQGATWVRVDLRQAARTLGVDPDALGALANADPASQLQRLTRTTGIKPAGTTTVDGTRVTRYAGRVTARQSLQALPADQRAKVESALGKLGGTKALDQTSDLEVDVDDQGRIRRQVQDVAIPAQGGGSGGELHQQIDYSDFGAALDLPTPSGSEVYDATSVLGQLAVPGAAGARTQRG